MATKLKIFDTSSGTTLSLSQFKKATKERVQKDYVSKNKLISQKILTKSQINKALKELKLSPFSYKNVTYFKLEELRNLLNSFKNNVSE